MKCPNCYDDDPHRVKFSESGFTRLIILKILIQKTDIWIFVRAEVEYSREFAERSEDYF